MMSAAHAQAPQVGVAAKAVAAQAAPAEAKLAYDSASKLSGYKRAGGTWLIEPRYKPLWVSEPTMTEARFSEGLIAARDRPSNKVGFVDAQGR